MPRSRAKKLLYDIQQAADAIASFVEGKTPEDYLRDLLLRSGVERQFQIIGEALNRLSKVEPELVAQIEDFRDIISFRNILVHGYDVVTDEIVWANATGKLPSLRATVARLLAT
jgi:uncharacterized protein with HEPN domain